MDGGMRTGLDFVNHGLRTVDPLKLVVDKVNTLDMEVLTTV